MTTLPRHLLLAAVVLTVCCAERQAVSATVDLQKLAAQVAGERYDQSRLVQNNLRQQQVRHRYIRPAAIVWQERLTALYGCRPTPASPQSAVVHAIYPPSRFRLPPPSLLA